jgi:hypothetical protein
MTADTHQRLAAASGTRAHEDLPHACHCGTRWSGNSTCHCAACHQYTFVGVTAFDRHRKGGTCATPSRVGMVLATGRAYPAWTVADTTEETTA